MSSHFYKKDSGKPCYEVPKKSGKDGEMRAVTIKDARTLNLVPSVTTILGIMDKPALTYWLQQQTALASRRVRLSDYLNEDAWVKAVIADSGKKTTTAADKGTEIHDALEKFFDGGEILPNYGDICAEVYNKLISEYKLDCIKLHVEKYFAHPLGYGGRCDLHTTHGKGVVIDYKTKEKFPVDSKGRVKNMGYIEHCMQLKAYAVGLGIPHARLLNVFIQYNGEVVIKEWTEAEADKAWEQFQATLALWKIIKNYDSSY